MAVVAVRLRLFFRKRVIMKRLVRILFPVLLIPSCSFSALTDYLTVWEVRASVGNDTNGAGFTTGSTGTNMSQFDNKNSSGCSSCQSGTVNLSTTDAVTVGTAVVTSATANFSNAIVGNVIYLAGGISPLTAAWYNVITFTNSTTIVVDRNVSASTGVTMNVGGALATLDQMSNNLTFAAGSGAWVKATAMYSISSTVTFAAGAPNSGFYFINGYTSTRGDNGKPTVLGLVGIAGGNNYMLRFNNSPYGMILQNFTVDCGNQNVTRGIFFNSANETVKNTIVQNCSDFAFNFAQSAMCIDCTTFNVPSSTASASTGDDFHLSNNDLFCINCAALGSTVDNAVAFNAVAGAYFQGLIAANFTGANTIAVRMGTQEDEALIIINASIYGFTGDALHYNEGTVDVRPLLFRNIVISNIGGYCVSQNGALPLSTALKVSDYIACNTTGALGFYNNWPAGAHDVTLSVSPFTNGAGNDFSLNSTAGGGAALKQTGYPGVLLNGGGTGFISFGALEPQSSGSSSGGGSSVFPN